MVFEQRSQILFPIRLEVPYMLSGSGSALSNSPTKSATDLDEESGIKAVLLVDISFGDRAIAIGFSAEDWRDDGRSVLDPTFYSRLYASARALLAPLLPRLLMFLFGVVLARTLTRFVAALFIEQSIVLCALSYPLYFSWLISHHRLVWHVHLLSFPQGLRGTRESLDVVMSFSDVVRIAIYNFTTDYTIILHAKWHIRPQHAYVFLPIPC